MLKSLKHSDIDSIIEACSGPAEPLTEIPVEVSAATRERVYDVVENLPREAQEELLALMWTGGPKNCNTFPENLDLARKTWDENHASHIAEQHATLPVYLRDGLERLSAERG